jgi:acyl carrier protein
MDPIAAQIQEFISATLLKLSTGSIAVDEPIVSSRLIDSFGLVELALFIETRFGVRIEDSELNSSSFDTIETLSQLVSSRIR